mgnify:CR=1 FL=1
MCPHCSAAIAELQLFKTKDPFWMAFAVQTDFQKYCKKAFTALDIDNNMVMAKELEMAVNKLSSEITKLNKMDAARCNT